MTEMSSLQEVAKAVQERAAELLMPVPRDEMDAAYIKDCLDGNERGDGCLFASLFKDQYLHNVTPERGEWFRWVEHVWERDSYERGLDAVELCALEYLELALVLQEEIRVDEIHDKKHADYWKVEVYKKFKSRVDRLRTDAGARKAMGWSKVVDRSMACEEMDLNQNSFLLPVINGVIDLKTGALTQGRPADLMTQGLKIEYDPHADYEAWHKFLVEITGSEEIVAFLKRSFGHAISGDTTEQKIWVFIGPGRNGKGVLFGLMKQILGPFYHELNRSTLLEQRNPPSPNAASEHLYSLVGKRLVVGGETNKRDKIDGASVKGLTGDDPVNCRQNFEGERTFDPTHKIFLHTNNIPYGLTADFALVQRLVLLILPYRYVDDVEDWKKKDPGHAETFRKRDNGLKEKFMGMLPGILRWLVEGCLEWQEIGLATPDIIKDNVTELAASNDYIGSFITDALEHHPDDKKMRLKCTGMYAAFKWWWNENMDDRDLRMPAMKTINKSFRDRGHVVDKIGGRTYIYQVRIKLDVALEVDAFDRNTR